MESLTDPLTSVANRKQFDRCLEHAVIEANTRGQPLSLMIADIDYFKKFNDTYGHLTGDHVLRLVARTIKDSVKGQDVVARYGGEEFAVILPNTSVREAQIVGENVRKAVMARELRRRSTAEILGRVTVSIGAAELQGEEAIQDFIDRADKCLYTAKIQGRNRVSAEADLDFVARPIAARG
jgi:diguanylate cyclase